MKKGNVEMYCSSFYTATNVRIKIHKKTIRLKIMQKKEIPTIKTAPAKT